jgi:hypothetical protein
MIFSRYLISKKVSIYQEVQVKTVSGFAMPSHARVGASGVEIGIAFGAAAGPSGIDTRWSASLLSGLAAMLAADCTGSSTMNIYRWAAVLAALWLGWKIWRLVLRHRLVLRARSWPRIEAQVMESGSETHKTGYGKNLRYHRKNWIKVGFSVSGQHCIADVLDAHTPGVPGDELVYNRPDSALDSALDFAAQLAGSPPQKGTKLQVAYDPVDMLTCMQKPEAYAVFYTELLMYIACLGAAVFVIVKTM